MLTKRDLTIALFAAVTSAAIVVMAQPAKTPKPIMHSSAFDWNDLTATTNSYGSTRKVFNNPTVTLENFECHITTVLPGHASHMPHHHGEEELIIVKEGTVEVMANGGEWKKIGPGSLFFASSNELHGIRNAGDVPAVYHVLRWHTAATPADN